MAAEELEVHVQERMDKFGRLKPEPEQNALKGSKMEGPQDVRLQLFHAMHILHIRPASFRRPLCMVSQGRKPQSHTVRIPRLVQHAPACWHGLCRAHGGDGHALRLIVLLLSAHGFTRDIPFRGAGWLGLLRQSACVARP